MIEPTKIIEESETDISISWSDETESRFSATSLRRSCPCAACIDEWTGEKMLKDDSISEDLRFSKISIVGRYALNFEFSDGHETGIFSFKFLRGLSDGD